MEASAAVMQHLTTVSFVAFKTVWVDLFALCEASPHSCPNQSLDAPLWHARLCLLIRRERTPCCFSCWVAMDQDCWCWDKDPQQTEAVAYLLETGRITRHTVASAGSLMGWVWQRFSFDQLIHLKLRWIMSFHFKKVRFWDTGVLPSCVGDIICSHHVCSSI